MYICVNVDINKDLEVKIRYVHKFDYGSKIRL